MPSFPRLVALAVSTVALAACVRGPDPHVAFVDGASSSAPTLTAPATTTHLANLSADGHLKPLLADARKLFESPRFAAHLAALETVAVDADGEHLSGRALLDALSNAKLAVDYRLAGEGKSCDTSGGETAHTDPPSTPPTPTTTCVQPIVIDRADNVHPDAYACDINTIVHEWMHAVVDAQGNERFTDKGHKGSKVPLVSYTVGAIAQCTFLEESFAELPPAEFVKCVEAVGVRNFYYESCAERWFEDGKWNH